MSQMVSECPFVAIAIFRSAAYPMLFKLNAEQVDRNNCSRKNLIKSLKMLMSIYNQAYYIGVPHTLAEIKYICTFLRYLPCPTCRFCRKSPQSCLSMKNISRV